MKGHAYMVSCAILLLGLGPGSAQANVAAVKGSAYGYSCVVNALGSSCTPSRATPIVTLSTDASNSPARASAATGHAAAGPATIFSSGSLMVSTTGTRGPAGSVASSTTIIGVNASGQEHFTASRLASRCNASETSVGGSTTITGGKLLVDSGDEDPTNSIPNHAAVEVPLPANPPANTTYTGHLHIGDMTDSFKWVFNERSVSRDGSVTVNAAHEYLLGPLATGNLIVGNVVCGTTAGAFEVVDRTPPKVQLSGPKTQRLGRSVLVRVSCPIESCRATARATVRVPRLGVLPAKRYKLKKASGAVRKGGERTLRPRLSRAARRAIRRALRRGCRIRVKLKVTAADKAKNRTTRTRRVRLRL